MYEIGLDPGSGDEMKTAIKDILGQLRKCRWYWININFLRYHNGTVFMKGWPKTNRLPVVSPAKMRLFKINKELQFRISNHGKTCASPYATRRGGRTLLKGKTEVGRAIVNKESIGGIESSKCSGFTLAESWQSLIGWALARQEKEVFLLPVGLCYCHRAWELPLLAFQLLNWGFCLMIFLQRRIFLFLGAVCWNI